MTVVVFAQPSLPDLRCSTCSSTSPTPSPPQLQLQYLLPGIRDTLVKTEAERTRIRPKGQLQALPAFRLHSGSTNHLQPTAPALFSPTVRPQATAEEHQRRSKASVGNRQPGAMVDDMDVEHLDVRTTCGCGRSAQSRCQGPVSRKGGWELAFLRGVRFWKMEDP